MATPMYEVRRGPNGLLEVVAPCGCVWWPERDVLTVCSTLTVDACNFSFIDASQALAANRGTMEGIS